MRTDDIVAVAVFVPVAILLTVWSNVHRDRRGGPGPAVYWVPKFSRKWLNRYYEAHGWQPPFTFDGSERNPDAPKF